MQSGRLTLGSLRWACSVYISTTLGILDITHVQFRKWHLSAKVLQYRILLAQLPNQAISLKCWSFSSASNVQR